MGFHLKVSRKDVDKLQNIVDRLSNRVDVLGEMRALMEDPSMPPAGVAAITDAVCDKVEEMADIIAEMDAQLTIFGKSNGVTRRRSQEASVFVGE